MEDAALSAPRSSDSVDPLRAIDPFEGRVMISVMEFAVPVYIAEREETGGYVLLDINEAAAELLTGQRGTRLGPTSPSEAFPDKIARRVAASCDLCLRTGQPLEHDSTVPSPRGNITARTTIYPLKGGGDVRPRMLCIMTDVTEERRIRNDLDQSNARLAAALDALGGAPWFYDVVRRVFELGPSFSRFLGARYRPVMTMSEWLEFVHPDDRDSSSFVDLLDGTERQWVAEFRIIDELGGVRWLRCFRRTVLNGTVVSGVAGVAVDITADRQRESALIEQALTDPLTGLANRRGLEQFLAATEQEGTGLCVIMIDIDQFKAYNDAYGHVAGDAILCRVGSAIDEVVSPLGGMVARYGGEEFVVVVPRSDILEAKLIAESLLRAIATMAEPHATSQHSIITISAGYVTRAGRDPRVDLLASADVALYMAKRAGRNCCRPALLEDAGEYEHPARQEATA